jgi:hypothetical protein
MTRPSIELHGILLNGFIRALLFFALVIEHRPGFAGCGDCVRDVERSKESRVLSASISKTEAPT